MQDLVTWSGFLTKLQTIGNHVEGSGRPLKARINVETVDEEGRPSFRNLEYSSEPPEPPEPLKPSEPSNPTEPLDTRDKASSDALWFGLWDQVTEVTKEVLENKGTYTVVVNIFEDNPTRGTRLHIIPLGEEIERTDLDEMDGPHPTVIKPKGPDVQPNTDHTPEGV